MNLLAVKILEEIGILHKVQGWMAIYEGLCVTMIFYGLFAIWYQLGRIKRALIPVFDQRFKKYVPPYYKWTTHRHHFVRATQYALWVFSPQFYKRINPEIRDYNFRAELDAQTIKVCKIYAIHFIGMFFFLFTWMLMLFIDWLIQ